jgi:Fur family ferric uptake transcriptional regulator
MEAQERFKTILRSHNLRLTQQTQAIFDILFSNKKPLNAGQIAKELPTINPSTIHRTLERFTEVGITVSIPCKNFNKYELGEEFIGHHHHFTCTKCATSYPIHDCYWDNYQANLEQTYGTVTSHTIEVRGICKKCQ